MPPRLTQRQRYNLWVGLSQAQDLLCLVVAGSAIGLLVQGDAPVFLSVVCLGLGLFALVKRLIPLAVMLGVRRRR